MKIDLKIGTLVRQKVQYHETYRYGLVAPTKERQLVLPHHIPVLWTPDENHQVSKKLYYEAVSKESLEILSTPN